MSHCPQILSPGDKFCLPETKLSPRDEIFAHGDKIIANLHEEETTFYCCTKIEDQTMLPGNRCDLRDHSLEITCEL